MTDDHLTERLRRLGRDRVPPVDGAFANRLEADLRTAHAGPRGARIADLLVRPVAVLAALAVVVGVVAVFQRDDARPGVAMVAADGTTVSIPGGDSLVAGRAGLDLPDGTRIEVDDGGSAVVAGVVLEAGSSAIVVDGRIELVDSPALTTVEPPIRTTTTTAPATTDAPTTSDATAPTPSTTDAPTTSGDQTTTPSTTPSTTTGPDPTDSRPPSTTTAPTTDTGSSPTTASTTSTVDETGPTTTRPPSDSTTEPRSTVGPDRPIVGLTIGPVRRGEATLTWRVDGPTDAIAGWEVRIVRDGTAKSIAFIRVADARRLRVEVPDGRVAYRVVARSGGDGVVARSSLVSPGG